MISYRGVEAIDCVGMFLSQLLYNFCDKTHFVIMEARRIGIY